MAAALPKMKSTVPLATAVPSRARHAGGGVELFKLDCKDDLWVSSYRSDGLWFSSAPFRCVCCGGLFVLEFAVVHRKSVEGINRRS